MPGNICARCGKQATSLQQCPLCDKWFDNKCYPFHGVACTGPDPEPEPKICPECEQVIPDENEDCPTCGAERA